MKTKHILVIRFSAIGDVAMSTHVLLKVIKTYPDVKITVLSKDFMASLFDDLPQVEFFAADVSKKYKGFWGLLKLSFQLNKLKIDTIADIHNVIRSRLICVFIKLINPKITIKHINKYRYKRKTLTRLKNKVFKPLKRTHERYADVFKSIGLPVSLDETDLFPKRYFTNSKMSFSGKKVGIAPFAAFKTKEYPFTQVEEVIKELIQNKSLKIFLFGGPEDMEKLYTIESKYKNVIAVGKLLVFKDELSVISNLDLMISMDSANVHLAGMYGVTTITIWGVTHPYCGFEVFGNNNTNLMPDTKQYPLIPTSIYGNFGPSEYTNAIASIPPERIIATTLELLGIK